MNKRIFIKEYQNGRISMKDGKERILSLIDESLIPDSLNKTKFQKVLNKYNKETNCIYKAEKLGFMVLKESLVIIDYINQVPSIEIEKKYNLKSSSDIYCRALKNLELYLQYENLKKMYLEKDFQAILDSDLRSIATIAFVRINRSFYFSISKSASIIKNRFINYPISDFINFDVDSLNFEDKKQYSKLYDLLNNIMIDISKGELNNIMNLKGLDIRELSEKNKIEMDIVKNNNEEGDDFIIEDVDSFIELEKNSTDPTKLVFEKNNTKFNLSNDICGSRDIEAIMDTIKILINKDSIYKVKFEIEEV